MADDDDERQEELSSITAIFPELIFDPANPFHAALTLPVEPAKPVPVEFTQLTGTSSGTVSEVKEWVRLAHLPSVHLEIALPAGYPENAPPDFILTTTPSWLPPEKLRELEEEGFRLWEDYGHTMIVFAYIDYLQQAADRAFDLVSLGSDETLKLPSALRRPVMDFNAAALRTKFEAETFECGICLEPKKGSACHRMRRCGHVFCVACLQDGYNLLITEGQTHSVKCLDVSCAKKTSTLSPGELLDIPLAPEKVLRFVEIRRKKKIESDRSTVYCPRKWCQGPARSKKYPKPILDPETGLPTQLDEYEDEDEDSSSTSPKTDSTTDAEHNSEIEDRLAICESCTYAFCRVCQRGWHGDLIRCRRRTPDEIAAEEKASEEYILKFTSPCPRCYSPVQKTHGCNHMQCSQCRTHFCYLCSETLRPENPYKHFNVKGTDCYQRLFEMVDGDEGGEAQDGEHARFFVGARRWEHDALAFAAGVGEDDEDGDIILL